MSDFDETESGNDPIDQALWEFETKSGYDDPDYSDDELQDQQRVVRFRGIFKALLKAASPKEREVLRAALAQLKSGQKLNWEAIARDLGKTSGAVKTQVSRVVAKWLRDKG